MISELRNRRVTDSVSPKLVSAWMDALGCGGTIIAIPTPAVNAASNSFGIVLPPQNQN